MSPGEGAATRSQSQPPSSESNGGGEETINDNDMLSRLPDHILIRILSFLPTKCARRTSMLSRRWTRKWPRLYEHVPVLDLAQSDFRRCPEDLCTFLAATNCIKGPLRSLKIHADISSCWCWIDCLGNLGLEKLHVIDGARPDGNSLSKFLSVTSLKELHLNLDGNLTWPSHTHMPFLRKLHLQSIILTGIYISSYFPALEDFTMSGCILQSDLVVSSSLLKRFALTYCRANRILVTGNSLADLSINSCTFEAEDPDPLRVEISAPNVRYFTWERTELVTCSISTFNSLVSASINVCPGGDLLVLKDHRLVLKDKKLVLKDIKLLISAVSRARRLRLGECSLEALDYREATDVSFLADLRVLEIQTGYCRYDLLGILCFLMRCPNLTHLVFNNAREDINEEHWLSRASKIRDKNFWNDKNLLVDKLRTVEFLNLIGSDMELELILYLLDVAVNLTKITIRDPSFVISSWSQAEMLSKMRKNSKVEGINSLKLIIGPQLLVPGQHLSVSSALGTILFSLRGLQQLQLVTYMGNTSLNRRNCYKDMESLRMPVSLFLVSLTEMFLDLQNDLLYWPAFDLPSLKKLHLRRLHLKSLSGSPGKIISSSCPNLEKWTMETCHLPNVLDVSGSKLVDFSMRDCVNVKDFHVHADRLTDLSIFQCFTTTGNEVDETFDITAPNLLNFKWDKTHLFKHFKVPSLVYLESTSLTIQDKSQCEGMLVRRDLLCRLCGLDVHFLNALVNLMKGLSNVSNKFSIGSHVIKALGQSHSKALEENATENINPNNIIVLNAYKNLLTLELWLHHSEIYYMGIYYLLNYCPKLETLIIHNGKIVSDDDSNVVISEPKHLLLEDLETTQIYEFIGSLLEVSFIRSLLRVSKKLTKITIFPASHFFLQDRCKQRNWQNLSLLYQLGKEDVFDVVFPDYSALP